MTELQQRILTAAERSQGRIILWVLANGRVNIPGFTEDAADALRALEGAGLLALDEAERKLARGTTGPRSVGSHVFHLTAAGARALQG